MSENTYMKPQLFIGAAVLMLAVAIFTRGPSATPSGPSAAVTAPEAAPRPVIERRVARKARMQPAAPQAEVVPTTTGAAPEGDGPHKGGVRYTPDSPIGTHAEVEAEHARILAELKAQGN